MLRHSLAVLLLVLASNTAYAQPHVHGISDRFSINGTALTDIGSVGRMFTFDTATGEIIASLPLPGCVPTAIVARPDGARIYVACTDVAHNTGLLLAIDPVARQVLASRSFPSPFTIALIPPGDRAVVATSTVQIVDLASFAATDVMTALGRAVTSISVAPDGSHAYLSANGRLDGCVHELNLATLEFRTDAAAVFHPVRRIDDRRHHRQCRRRAPDI